jgi:hypothetical protein
MTGFEKCEQATTEERMIHGLFRQLDFLFSFHGLHHYKAKFATSWEPRYLVYSNVLELPRTAFALHRLSEIKKEKTSVALAKRDSKREVDNCDDADAALQVDYNRRGYPGVLE